MSQVEQKRRYLFEVQWQAIRDEWVSGGMQSGGLKGLAERSFNAALDAVVIELPESWVPVYAQEGGWEMMGKFRAAIEAAGLKVKP